MDKLWWRSIPNPAGMIRKIIDEVDETGCAAYVIPAQLEWQDSFRALLDAECQYPQRTLRIVDAERYTDTAPGELLLREFVTHPTLAEGYRRSIGYAKYLADADPISGLGDLCIFVRNTKGKTTEEWCRFIADYRKAHKPDDPLCYFLVECIDTKPDNGSGLKVIDYQKCVKAFDISIFCMLACSQLSNPPLLQSYAAELAAALGTPDPELAALLIENGERLIQNPQQTIQELLETKQRSDDSPFTPPESVQELVWRAQVKSFFPMIEQYRIQLIGRFAKEIPVHEEITGTFGQRVEDIWDIDLGTFKLLCDSKRMHIPQPDYDTMCFYRDCRNALAHTNALTYQEIERLTVSA